MASPPVMGIFIVGHKTLHNHHFRKSNRTHLQIARFWGVCKFYLNVFSYYERSE
nr:MAG TPA: hypothetical protein [Caudoviricetes sp.]